MSLNLLVSCLDCGQDVAECRLRVFPRYSVAPLPMRCVSARLYHSDEWA